MAEAPRTPAPTAAAVEAKSEPVLLSVLFAAELYLPVLFTLFVLFVLLLLPADIDDPQYEQNFAFSSIGAPHELQYKAITVSFFLYL